MKFITESNIAYLDAFLMSDRFVMLNMWKEGIWLVDKQHSKWQAMKETAIAIAKTFGDLDTISTLQDA